MMRLGSGRFEEAAMTLPGAKHRELVAALAADYPSDDALRMMVTFNLDRHVAPTRFDWTQDVESMAFEIVEWATSEGKVRELIEAAYDPQKPNTRVAAIYRQLPGWLADEADGAGYPLGGRKAEARGAPPAGVGPLPAALGGFVLLAIVLGVGFMIYRANARQGAVPTTTPVQVTTAPAGNIALSNLRVTESALGRDFLGSLLNLDGDCKARNSCIENALAEWLDQTNGDPGVAEQLDEMFQTVGLVFRFDAEFQDLLGEPCTIRWTVFDVADGTPSKVGDAYLVGQPGFPYRAFTPESDRDPEQLVLWIPMPPRDGTYSLTLEAFEGPAAPGATPEFVDSAPFVIRDFTWVGTEGG